MDCPSKHGMSKSPEYAVWANITNRCLRPTNPNYKHYGERGIGLYPPWRDFREFYAYVGDRPTEAHTIERIDNEKGYEPGNVKWATRKEQMRNTRASNLIAIDGVCKNITDWAEENDLHYTTVIHRMKRGMNARDAIFTPARFGGRRASKR